MYNEEVKRKFLSVISKNAAEKNYVPIFNDLEEYEVLYGLDVSEWDREKLIKWFNSKGFIMPNTVRTTIGLIAVYADSVTQKHEIRSLHVGDIDYASGLKSIITKSPEELRAKIQMVYPLDSGRVAMPMLAFAWCGIPLSKMLTITNDEVNTINGTIRDSSNLFIVSSMPDPIREILNIYNNTRVIAREQNHAFEATVDDIGYFLKKFLSKNSAKVGSRYTKTTLATAVTDMQIAYDTTYKNGAWCTCSNVALSGRLWRVHQLALSGVNVLSVKNAEKVCEIMDKPIAYFKDVVLLYDAYLKIINE